ncbi:MAG: phytoene desaturase family protein [Desertimonas sp.]
MSRTRFDVVVIGGGHNGLAAAAYLARAGRSVVVLERDDVVGGAARSAEVFAGLGARLSKYSYLVSLLPELVIDELGLDIELCGRRISSYTPVGGGGVLVDDGDPGRTDGDLGGDAAAWHRWYELTTRAAGRLFPTLTEPLRDRDAVRRHLGDDETWSLLVERPLGVSLSERFADDVVRGIVGTDGLIGTFTSLEDPSLLANRCLLYHVIGRGTGRWDVPVGGMGALTTALAGAATSAGTTIRTGCAARAVHPGEHGASARVELVDGSVIEARHVLANVAPAVLDRLLHHPARAPRPEGAQLKINLLLRRLPRLRDPNTTPEQAFAGTFHINESYRQLETAYRQAAAGQIASRPPCEVYCHSLTDPSILSPDLQAQGAHTLTLFGLHMPARLFRADPAGALERATTATMASLDSVLAEPIARCLYDPSTIEVMGPLEIEANLGMPGGHIFHRDLQWPFAETEAEVGQWGVETQYPDVLICGAGARRGGGVSAIPGRNAAMAVLGS